MTAALALGIISGISVGLLATGVVLVYKANRFINVAHAQLGVVPAMVLAKLVLDWGWNWWAALPVGLVLGIATGLLIERVLVRPLLEKKTSPASMLLLMIGVAQLLFALTYVTALGPNVERMTLVGYPTPFDTTWTIGGLVLTGPFILVLVLGPLVIAALAAFLRLSLTGKRIRAAASNRDGARLAGISVGRTSALSWAIAGGLSALAAIVEAPSRGSFNDASSFGPAMLLLALGAAAVGGFVSIPAALVGGIGLGVVEQLVLYQTSDGAMGQLAVFVVVLAIILLRGGLISAVSADQGVGAVDRPPLVVPPELRGSALVRYQSWLLAGVSLVVAILLPLLPFFDTQGRRFELALVVVFAITGVGLTMVIGWSGQVSLGHIGVVGVGAFVTARLAEHGYSLVSLFVLAGASGALILCLCGLPAVRVRGMALTVTTLGLAVVAPTWLFKQPWLGSSQPTGVNVAPANVLDGVGAIRSQLDVYYLGLGVLAFVLALTSALRRTSAGWAIVAVRDNEAAAAAMGITPASVKLRFLAVSGAVAGMAGVVWALAWSVVATDHFSPAASLSIVAVPVFGGLGSLAGAVAGAVVLYLPVNLLAPHMGAIFGDVGRHVGFQLAMSGAGIIGFIVAQPHGIAGVAQGLWERWLKRVARQRVDQRSGHVQDPLVVADVDLSFGGVQALRSVSLRVGDGEIVGIIGGNGAGKTTLMNVVSGELRPESGSVRVLGNEVVGLPPEYRCAYGVARSFQDARLFPGLTVVETVQLAMSAGRRPGMVSSSFAAPWVRASEARDRHAAVEMLDRLGLTAWSDVLVSDLSTGTRRICELAVQTAGRPQVLLLDEPTAGVAQREAEAFAPLLRRIRDELDCSIVIIEHDMPLLMGLCDRIYAMEAGQVIAEGTPEEVRNDPRVIASYLGTDSVAIARSHEASQAAPRVPHAERAEIEEVQPRSDDGSRNGNRRRREPLVAARSES